MSPPPNKNETGPNVAHPEGVFLFQGSIFSLDAPMAINVYIKKHEGERWICVEIVTHHQVDGVRQTTHEWMSIEKYREVHTDLWQKADMEPNRDFNIGEGLRNENGEHLSGSSEICERDGTMKIEAIKAKCP